MEVDLLRLPRNRHPRRRSPLEAHSDSGSVRATFRRGQQRSQAYQVFLASCVILVSSLSIDATVCPVSYSLDAWTCRRDALTLFSGEHGFVQVFLYRRISATNDTAFGEGSGRIF